MDWGDTQMKRKNKDDKQSVGLLHRIFAELFVKASKNFKGGKQYRKN